MIYTYTYTHYIYISINRMGTLLFEDILLTQWNMGWTGDLCIHWLPSLDPYHQNNTTGAVDFHNPFNAHVELFI